MFSCLSIFCFLCALTSALPYESPKNTSQLFAQPITQDKSTLDKRQYHYITVTDPSTITYFSTIFKTATFHPVLPNGLVTITEIVTVSAAAAPLALAPNGRGHDNQLDAAVRFKPKHTVLVTATVHVTATKSVQEQKKPNFEKEHHALDQIVTAPGPIRTVTHTISSTISVKKHHPPITKVVTVQRTRVVTGKPAKVSTVVKTVRTTVTSLVITATETSILKLSTQTDGKRDVIIMKRGQTVLASVTEAISSQRLLPTGVEARAIRTTSEKSLGLLGRDGIPVTETITPSTTIFTTTTITVPGVWVASGESTITITMTTAAHPPAPAPPRARTDVTIKATNADVTETITVATETVIETSLRTIPISIVPTALPTTNPPKTMTAPPSTKTIDVTHVVTVPNGPASTVHKSETKLVTSTFIPPDLVVTQTRTVTVSVTSTGIYTMYLVSTSS